MATYEQRMKAYQEAKNKEEFLQRVVRGQKSVDITHTEDIFYQVNKDRVSIDQFTNRDKFKADAAYMKEFKRDLVDPTFARTKSKHSRLLGEIPAEIYYARKEFSDPNIPREERLKAMKKWFDAFPAFRAGDKRLL